MILTWLGKYREGGLLFLRVGLGLMFILHGWPKLVGGPQAWTGLGKAISSLGLHFGEPIQWLYTVFGFLAALAEAGGGLLMIIGLLFRPSMIMLACTMFVAFMSHWAKGDNFMQVTSRPLELCIVFVALIFIGPGKYSIDKG